MAPEPAPFDDTRVLIAHHWPFHAHRHPLVSPDAAYVTCDEALHPRVINVPTHANVDMGEILADLQRRHGWTPDLFIAKVDSFFGVVPRRVDALPCPKVLVLGDTQHGIDPLNRMIAYARSEPYDCYIADHKRHHLWYYWMAGIENISWLPGLFLNPPAVGFGAASYATPSVTSDTFAGKTVFIGQTGRFHPRRARLLAHAERHLHNLVATQLPQPDSLKAYRDAATSLNISLNGDLNLRTFEILAAGGLLLHDRLSDASGLDLLLTEGEEYLSYETAEELVEKAVFASDHPREAARIRDRAHQRYVREYSPPQIADHLTRCLEGRVEERFSIKSLKRIDRFPCPIYSKARIDIYQIIQSLHRVMERVDIQLDATLGPAFAEDYLDLPRVHIDVTTSGAAYRAALESYVAAAGCSSRVTFAEGNRPIEANVWLTTQCRASAMSRVAAGQLIVISDDTAGLDRLRAAGLDTAHLPRHDLDGGIFALGSLPAPW